MSFLGFHGLDRLLRGFQGFKFFQLRFEGYGRKRKGGRCLGKRVL